MALTRTAANVNANWEEGAIIKNFVAGGALVVGDAVYVNASDQVLQADANGASEAIARAIGVVVAAPNAYGETAIASGQNCSVCVHGIVRGFTGMTPGGQVYVSKTAGDLTQTAPTTPAYQYPVGYALKTDALFVQPETDSASSV